MRERKDPTDADRATAAFVVKTLETRNAGELRDAIGGMTVSSYRLMHEEIAAIIANGGKPPNWA